MDRRETTQFLALIKISYPAAYRDLDALSTKATIAMWHLAFSRVPYPLMEQALNNYRMTNKFAPTVAEIVAELSHIHYQAIEAALVHRAMGNDDLFHRYSAIIDITSRYSDPERLCQVPPYSLLSNPEITTIAPDAWIDTPEADK